MSEGKPKTGNGDKHVVHWYQSSIIFVINNSQSTANYNNFIVIRIPYTEDEDNENEVNECIDNEDEITKIDDNNENEDRNPNDIRNYG